MDDSIQSKSIADQELPAIVYSIEGAVVSSTIDGVILSWNKGAEKVYGYTEEEVIGKHLSILALPELPDEIPGVLQLLVQGQSVENYQTSRRRKDGTAIYVSLNITPIKDESGQVVAAFSVAQDITAGTHLTGLRNFLASIIETSQDAILSKNLDGFILSWNRGAEILYGYTPAEMIGKHVSILAPPDHADEIPAIISRLRRGERIEHYETIRLTKDKRRIHVSLTVSPIRDASGKLIAASAIGRDITAQKKEQEEKAKLMEELERSLSQKHLLLQEVYHRVKNNLQIISSLLDLRSRYILNDPQKAASAFEESIERIRAMSLVHEKLYNSGNLETLDFTGYLRSLIEQLVRTYAINKKIELTLEGDSVVFGLNTAIPLGLIFNELITNSLKHAFSNSNTGSISIRCHAANETITLSYSDNGSGLSESVDFATSETFGFRIIRLLTKQINGTITVSSNHGISIEIKIPYPIGVNDGSSR